MSATFKPDGTYLETEIAIKESEFPAGVMDYIKSPSDIIFSGFRNLCKKFPSILKILQLRISRSRKNCSRL